MNANGGWTPLRSLFSGLVIITYLHISYRSWYHRNIQEFGISSSNGSERQGWIQSDRFSTGGVPDVAVVMPCMLPDVIMTLDIALFSVFEGSTLPKETLIVMNTSGGLAKSMERFFGSKATNSPIMEWIRQSVLSFLKLYSEGVDPDVWKALEIDSEFYPSTSPLLTSLPEEAFNELDEKHNGMFQTLIAMHNEPSTPASTIAPLLPGFRIIFNDSNQGVAESRELGAKCVFPNQPLLDNQIVMYLDCDDLSSVHRVGLVAKAFETNPEAALVTGYFHRHNLETNMEDDMKGSDDLWSYDSRLKDIQDKYLPYIDNPDLKEHIYELQKDPSFLLVDEEILDYDSDDQKPGNFGWYLTAKRNFALGNLNPIAQMHNGNVAWRRIWLYKLMPFPRARVGQDARLLYKAFLHGARALPVEGKLITYTIPSGRKKRRAWIELKKALQSYEESEN